MAMMIVIKLRIFLTWRVVIIDKPTKICGFVNNVDIQGIRAAPRNATYEDALAHEKDDETSELGSEQKRSASEQGARSENGENGEESCLS